jgi:hypothetical protein
MGTGLLARRALWLACLVIPGLSLKAAAQERIRDNLFFLEEAFNQEPGVVQHIQSLQLSPSTRRFTFSFTQEWPIPDERHQVSFTLPILQPGEAQAGLGDILLHCRLQALGVGDKSWLALAPRLSLVLPSGDHRRKTGRGGLGVQMGLPVSMELGTSWAVHVNAGATFTPSAKSAGGRAEPALDLTTGLAVVWQPLSWLNPMVELVHQWTQEVLEEGHRRSTTVLACPGFRLAINAGPLVQIVSGLSAVLQLWPGEDRELGLIVYLSIEHRVW